MTEEEFKSKLTLEQYHILREKGTEPPFSGKNLNEHGKGIFKCAACGNELFLSETKFDSGSGWPSFYAPKSKDSIAANQDLSHGMDRTEVTCPKCKSHLGHVFDDGPTSLESYEGRGPAPTGKRYCINSLALDFEKSNSED